jgi:2',3'-cyclic-nucleotide 2'-phosphodiesterase (5'-nucleotidase family)
MIAPYRDGLSAEMNKVIGECPQFLMKSKPSSALGSFMADAMVSEMKYYKFKADFGIVNYGGIRGVIDSGAITVGQIFQVMPFENEVIILKIDKVQLQQIIDLIKSKGGEPFSKELLNLKEQEYYWLAASDYIANGGDGYTMLPNAYKRINTGIKLRNVLIEHITRVNKIKVDNSPRVL